jgi:hypothetical protein
MLAVLHEAKRACCNILINAYICQLLAARAV